LLFLEGLYFDLCNISIFELLGVHQRGILYVQVLVTLIIPATLALATFFLLNKKLSHSLIATVKIGSGLYKIEHQNIEVSFHEIDAGESDIRWDMEIKFPPQFEQLLRDLCEDKNDKLFVTRDAEPILY
jgi:hypothetical protein